jgi:hypothetical protein
MRYLITKRRGRYLDVSGGQAVQDEELHIFYSSPSIVRVTKLRLITGRDI